MTVTLIHVCKTATAQLNKIIQSGKGISIRVKQTSSESIHWSVVHITQYSTIFLYFSYNFEGIMILIILVYLITGKSAKARVQSCFAIVRLCPCIFALLHRIFDFAISHHRPKSDSAKVELAHRNTIWNCACLHFV